VDGGQLVKNEARAFFGRGEGGGGGSKTYAHRPGVPGRSLPGRQRVGQLAFAIRGRPGDRRLLPVAAIIRTPHAFLGALTAVGRGQHQCLRALDGLKGIPVCAGHQTAKFSDEFLNLFLPLVGHALAPVGEDLTLVGRTLPLVGRTLALVGRTLALVGEGLTPVGRTLALLGLTLALAGEGFAYVRRLLALAQALGRRLWCLALAVHALKNALVR
jgi:hypothetical protein